MKKVNITSLRKDLFNMLNNIVQYNEIINVSTKFGNAVILSEKEYNGIIATLELCSNSQVKEKIINGSKAPVEECINIDEAQW